MKLPVLNAEGKELRRLDVDDTVFGIQPNGAVLHQAFVTQRANQRWGTANTKTRGEVQGSTRKIRMQKYTGRARQGSIRAPHHVGGGTVFGPRQRSYAKALPRKMRRLAIRSALSGKVADGQLVVIDQLAFDTPRTKDMLRILNNLGIDRSALVVTQGPDPVLKASARNLEKTKVMPAAYLNVVDMLNYNKILMTEDAVRVAEQLWGSRAAPATEKAPARRPAARAKAEEAPVAPAEAPVKPARRAVKAEAAPLPAEAEAPAKPARARRAPAKAEATAPGVEAPAEAPKPARRPRATKTEAPITAQEPKPRRPAKKTGEEA